MEPSHVALVAIALLGVGLVSRRLQNTILTLPMVFVAFGFVVSGSVTQLFQTELPEPMVEGLAEITLVVLLFTDASGINLRALRREERFPMRLLLIGLPLTILAGVVVAWFMFDGFTWWQAAILATILAPTDIALGQSFAGNKIVPENVRQSLEVESGLNDGICFPFFLIAVCGASIAEHPDSTAYWIRFTSLQIVLGPLVGIAVSYVGGKLIGLAARSGWMNESFEKLSTLGIALLAFGLAELVGGNGFIAAFVAGLTFGASFPVLRESLIDFSEVEGVLLTMLVFLVVGLQFAPQVMENWSWMALAYAVLSLTLIRLIPVCVALIGSGVSWQTAAIFGWFGPRGVASIVFVLILLESKQVPLGEELAVIAMTTIVLSVFAHGISASPLSRWYSRLAPSDNKSDKDSDS